MYSLMTLGRLSLEQDGAPVPGFDVHRKGASILVILAAQERVRRDRVMALLWPDSDTEHARGSLTQALHQLRQALGTSDLVQGSTELQLNPARITTDISLFTEALGRGDDASAVTLYAGPFLDGEHLNGSANSSTWSMACGPISPAAGPMPWNDLPIGRKRPATSSGRRNCGEQRYDREPTDGRGAVRLLRALDHSGQRTSALRHAAQHQQRLHDEWDLPPDPAVASLVDEWRAHQPPRIAPPATRSPVRSRTRCPGNPRPITVAVPWLVGTAAALLLLAGAAAWTIRTPSPARDPALVAVAPFHVVDTSLASGARDSPTSSPATSTAPDRCAP